MDKKLSLMRKFKIYSHRLNIDMIVFFRLNSWVFYGEKAVEEIFSVVNIPKELAILQQILSILSDNVAMYDDAYDLTDKSLNYHQYFTAVYHIEKLTILKKQVIMVTRLIEILTKVDSGVPLEEAAKDLTRAERTVLRPYLNTVKIWFLVHIILKIMDIFVSKMSPL